MKFQLYIQSLRLIHVHATCSCTYILRCTHQVLSGLHHQACHQAVLCKGMHIKLTACRALLAGQLLIVHTIRSFGALVFATIMTTRQFVSVLASCIIFGHPLSPGQW